MKTIQFFASLGYISGYHHDNKSTDNNPIALLWQAHAAAVYAETGIYIGAVISPAKTVYHKDWGCPDGGEDTVSITGTCNPNYTDLEKFKENVIEVLTRMAKSLKQSTSQVSFVEADFSYLDFR